MYSDVKLINLGIFIPKISTILSTINILLFFWGVFIGYSSMEICYLAIFCCSPHLKLIVYKILHGVLLTISRWIALSVRTLDIFHDFPFLTYSFFWFTFVCCFSECHPTYVLYTEKKRENSFSELNFYWISHICGKMLVKKIEVGNREVDSCRKNSLSLETSPWGVILFLSFTQTFNFLVQSSKWIALRMFYFLILFF